MRGLANHPLPLCSWGRKSVSPGRRWRQGCPPHPATDPASITLPLKWAVGSARLPCPDVGLPHKDRPSSAWSSPRPWPPCVSPNMVMDTFSSQLLQLLSCLPGALVVLYSLSNQRRPWALNPTKKGWPGLVGTAHTKITSGSDGTIREGKRTGIHDYFGSKLREEGVSLTLRW